MVQQLSDSLLADFLVFSSSCYSSELKRCCAELVMFISFSNYERSNAGHTAGHTAMTLTDGRTKNCVGQSDKCFLAIDV